MMEHDDYIDPELEEALKSSLAEEPEEEKRPEEALPVPFPDDVQVLFREIGGIGRVRVVIAGHGPVPGTGSAGKRACAGRPGSGTLSLASPAVCVSSAPGFFSSGMIP